MSDSTRDKNFIVISSESDFYITESSNALPIALR
jgi:hypothetical protein